MDWTSGYVAEIDYTHGYYRELAPGLIDFALLLSGYEPPERAGGRYLELGYGQGLSANIHAAANAGEFWGTDFNPAHAANAQSLTHVSGSGAHFGDDSFAELLARKDLPSFDYIVLHGVWSWVSDENRRAIVEIMRHHLRVGGAVYMSYNTLPGWAVAMPLRHMMSLHAEAAGSDVQGVVGRIEGSLAFGQKLAEVGARYFQANPTAKARLDAIAGQNRNYLAHEYFNRDWTPMYFSDAHEWLSDAKLGYACAAAPLDQLDAFNLTQPQRELLAGIPYTVLRETVRDYLLNAQFRRDLYTRGARRLSPLERIERLHDLRIAPTTTEKAAPNEVETQLGKITLRKEIYEPILEALKADGGSPKRIRDLSEHKALAKLPPGALTEGLAVLTGVGRAHPAQSDEAIEKAAPACDRLNAHLIDRSRISGDVSWLASPVIGAGVQVSRFEQMFLGARAKGKKTPDEWAGEAWSVLSKQNQSIIKNGEMLKTAEANLDELKVQAKALADERLPLLKRLRVTA
ncbi:MAG TPA: class I SAM-dependent methyltransferase [Caulobacteraceae bacterium]|nr:class I SAM-dependent methyltransferase [Caulobacteraceae bacterium]